MKRLILFISLACFSLQVFAQELKPYEIERDMPVFLDKVKANLTYPLAWGNSSISDFNEWRKAAQAKILDCMLTPPPVAGNYNIEIIATEKRNTYIAQKIKFDITAYSRVPAYLLKPEGKGPFPAVVILHDHGAHFSIGKEKMVRPFGVDSTIITDADKWSVRFYDGQYLGDYLAANGYVVIAVDALFWGERGRKEGVNYNSQQALASNFMQLGMSWSGFITYEDMYTADFLSSLEYVDKDRIACAGFSMGAYRAWMLAALSDKVKAGAALSWINVTGKQLSWDNERNNKGDSDFAMQLPGIRNYLDYPHIASVACPKPMLFINGTKDKLFPVETVQTAFDIMRKVWQSRGAGDKLVTKFTEQAHFCSKDMQNDVLQFLNKYLK